MSSPLAYQSGSATASEPSTVEEVKSATAEVGSTAKDAGSEVAQSVAEQAKEVLGETKRQARDLVSEGAGHLKEQARMSQGAAAQGLSTLADELLAMASHGGQSGVATELAHQAADRVSAISQWLTDREPGDLLEEVRSFARNKPAVFLLGAAVAGLAAGRLTRGAVAAAHDGSDRSAATGQHSQSATPLHSSFKTVDADDYSAGSYTDGSLADSFGTPSLYTTPGLGTGTIAGSQEQPYVPGQEP
jgi:hypothetical protein